ncbi:hypothetical protein GCM10010052_12620 [Paenarthrobacter histidinolovorans]|nr:hypothetical protein GCM10010052_12620 [Paenarthrobacter histidinolovorans]
MRLGNKWLRTSVTVRRTAITAKYRQAAATSQNPSGLAVQSSESRRITLGCYPGLPVRPA